MHLYAVVVKLGIAPVHWGIDPDYHWLPQLPPEEVLARTVACGYSATEFAYNFPRDPVRLRELLDQHALTLTAAFSPLDLLAPATLAENLEEARFRLGLLSAVGGTALLLADAGSPQRMAAAGRVDGHPELGLPEAAWEQLATTLDQLGREARELGLWIAFHHHAGTHVETEAEIDELMARTDPALVGLCLDTGHALHGGADPVALARRHGQRVKHVHVKDVDEAVLRRVRAEPISATEAAELGLYCRLGAGCVDLGGCIRELRAQGYEGWWIVEQDAAPEPVDEAAIANRRHVEPLLSSTGA